MENRNMEIRILNHKIFDGDGPLRALYDIEIDGWIVKGLRVTQHPNRTPYLVMSKGSVVDTATQRPHLEQLVFLPQDLWIAVERLILSQYKEETNKSNGTDTKETN